MRLNFTEEAIIKPRVWTYYTNTALITPGAYQEKNSGNTIFLIIHKALHSNQPIYLCSLLTPFAIRCCAQSTYTLIPAVACPRALLALRVFSVASLKFSNSLPSFVGSVSLEMSFWTKLKAHQFPLAHPSIAWIPVSTIYMFWRRFYNGQRLRPWFHLKQPNWLMPLALWQECNRSH